MGKLTSKAVQKLAKEGKKGMTGDGQGLYLQITAGGSASWIYRFKLQGKQRYMGLGSFSEVGLAQARERAYDYRKLVKNGIDPMKTSIEEEQASKATPSFTSCAARYIQSHRRSWRNAKHTRQWVSTLKTYARPVIGVMPVDEVTTQDVLKILAPIWTTKTETAKRVQGRIENVLDYAAAHNYRDPVNPARWRGHLDKLLAKPSRVKKVTHHPAMPYDEVTAFMTELQGYSNMSSKALQLLILTATRTSEVLHSQWKEIDCSASIWMRSQRQSG